jgi:hypothetical protein
VDASDKARIEQVRASVEQAVEQEKRILSLGDSVYMPPKVVHATFNIGTEDAEVVAILGQSVGDMGVEQVDMSGEARWNELRPGVEPIQSGRPA